MVRRRMPRSAWRVSRWPNYPLSKLAASLGLPGRDCLDNPWQLETLATVPWPADAGENLSLVWVDLPGGMGAEIQQWGLRGKQSASAAVAQALEEARSAGELGDAPESTTTAGYDDGRPGAQRHSRRTMTLYLPAEEVEAAQDAAAGQAQSLSRVVQHAWRRAHPLSPKPSR
jgi:hypothetical protein